MTVRQKRRRLSRSAEFDRVYRHGESVSSRYLVLYAFPRQSDAEAAGRKLGGQLAGVDGIQGIGIAPLDRGYAVKVNVRKEIPCDIPEQMNGVPVIVEIVGAIVAW